MNFIYFLNIIAVVPILFLVSVTINSRFRLGIFSVPTFLFVTTFPVTIAKRISPCWLGDLEVDNFYFAFAVLMDNIYYGIMLIKVWLLIKYFKTFENLYKKIGCAAIKGFDEIKSSGLQLRTAFYLSLVLYMVTFYALTNTNSDLLTWIKNPRSGYQSSRVAAGHWYALSIIFLGINTVVVFAYKIKNRVAFVFATVAYSYLWYLFGGKSYIISFYTLLLYSVVVSYGKKMGSIFFIASSIAAFLLVLGLFFNNPEEFDIDSAGDSIVQYFDHYTYATLFYQDYFELKLQLFAGEINLTKFYKYIPRVLFADKPFVYGPIIINEIYLPGMAEKGHTPEFAGQVPYFADFGILGVIIFNVFDLQFIFTMGTFFIALKNQFTRGKNTSWYLMFAVVYSLAPAFSQFITFPIDAIILMLFIWLAQFSSKRRLA